MAERRLTPRVRVALECTLRRSQGSPIDARTRDLGPGGMSVACKRPLRTDEVVSFELADTDVGGEARVLRIEGFDEYALRFEDISAACRARLRALTDGAA
jgi:PilZ domain